MTLADDGYVPSELERAHQQALSYGKDLARLFVVEQSCRRQLEQINQTLEGVLENVPQGLVLTDEKFVIQRCNPAFLRLLQAGPGRYVDRLLSELFPDTRFCETLAWLMNDGARTTRLEFYNGNKAITAFFAPLAEEGSQGWIVLFTDNSESRRIEQQKIDFVNLIAHEIRTPLTVILGYSQLIREDTEINDAIQDRLEPIYTGGRQLQRIVDEFLHFAEVVTPDNLRPDQVTNVDVAQLVAEVVDCFRGYTDERLILMQVFIPETVPQIQINPSLLATALTHLLLNGFESAPAGGILRIEVLMEGEELVIRVIDTGTEIPFDKREEVFELGAYGLSSTPGINDLRLGLPIAKHAVDRLGGVLTLEISRDKDTVFQLRLPTRQRTTPDTIQHLREELEAKHQQSMSYANDLRKLYGRLQRANRELKITNAQLEDSNQVKSNFLGLVSHELKTPISSLETALYLFKRAGTDNFNDMQLEMLEQITTIHQRTKELVNQLVKYAGLLSKQGSLNLRTLSVNALIERTRQTAAPMAQSRGITLEVDVDPGLSVTGDERLIEEALWQLVHNAIKATNAGGQITVRGHDGDGFIAFEVQDNGCGIPPEKQHTIWEAFTQTTDHLMRGMEGLGLGLALVRYVALAHRGQVVLESEPGIGSLIGFWIPTFQATEENET